MPTSEITIDLFKEWGKSVRVHKIQASLDDLTANAKKNGRSLDEEMKAQNIKSFDKFVRSCPLFDITCWPDELAELGIGFVLYFHFIGFMIVVLIVIVFVQIPILNTYNMDNAWIVGWHWHDWTNSWSNTECTCLGNNNGVTSPIGSETLSHESYGTECKAWDADFCASSPNSFNEIGRWCCVSWCFSSDTCLAPPNVKDSSMSNVHQSGMVRAASACAQDVEALAQCAFKTNVAFNEWGVERVDASRFVSSSWLTPGNYGPEQAEEAFIPWLYVAVVALLAVSTLGMHQFQKRTESKLDAAIVQPNDFAALVKGLPSTATDEKAIMGFFEEHALSGRRVELVKVVIGWDASDFRDQIATLRRLNQEEKQLKPSDPRKREIAKEIVDVKRNLASISPDAASRLASSGTVVVIFRYQQDLRECVERWNSFWAKWFYCDSDTFSALSFLPGFKKGARLPLFPIGDPPNYVNQIKITRAPNPGDINWEQFSAASYKNKDVVMRHTVAYVLQLVVTFLLYWGSTKLVDAIKKDKPELAGGLSALMALLLSIANASNMRLARYYGEKEFHDSHTQKEFRIAIMMILFLLVNTACVPLFLRAKPSEWYQRGGLVETMFYVLMLDAFMPPFIFFLDMKYVILGIRRRTLTEERLAKWNDIMQTSGGAPKSPEAEKEVKGVTKEIERFKPFFEPSEMYNPRRYANAMNTFLCTLFFSPVFPFGILIGIGGLIWQYCIDKYLLLRWYKRPSRPYDTQLAKWSLRFLKVVAPLGTSLSFFFFLSPSWKEKGQVLMPFLVSLFVSLTVSIFPSAVLRTLLGMRLLMAREGFRAHEEDEDYYKAQYLWAPSMKYHKNHFLYKNLIESKNPEFLSPGVDTTVKIDDVKSTYGSATAVVAEEAGDERPVISFRGGVALKHTAGSTDDARLTKTDPEAQSGAKASCYGATATLPSAPGHDTHGALPSAPGRETRGSLSRYGATVASSTTPAISSPVAPSVRPSGAVGHAMESSGEAEESSGDVEDRLAIVWEYDRGHGKFNPFGADCQDFIESRYQEYENGSAGPQIRRLKTAGLVITIDFDKMISQVLEPPSKRENTIRRSKRKNKINE